jgi:hypothetical protein
MLSVISQPVEVYQDNQQTVDMKNHAVYKQYFIGETLRGNL